jgi:hypothetical protein
MSTALRRSSNPIPVSSNGERSIMANIVAEEWESKADELSKKLSRSNRIMHFLESVLLLACASRESDPETEVEVPLNKDLYGALTTVIVRWEEEKGRKTAGFTPTRTKKYVPIIRVSWEGFVLTKEREVSLRIVTAVCGELDVFFAIAEEFCVQHGNMEIYRRERADRFGLE